MNRMRMIWPAAILLATVVSSATAVTNTFLEEHSTDWHTNGNWSLGHYPRSTEDVLIPDGKTCIISSANAEAYTVEVEDGATLENKGKDLEIDRTLTVDGTVYLIKPVGGSTPIINFTTAFTGASITGSGTVDAAKPDHGPGHLTWLDIPCSSALQINSGVTLKGSITIDISINNDGTLLVDHASDTMLMDYMDCIEGEGKFKVSAGQMTFGDTTPLSLDADADFEVSGGTIQFQNGSFTTTGQVSVSGTGTLDLDRSFTCSGGLSFTGGTITVAENKTATFE